MTNKQTTEEKKDLSLKELRKKNHGYTDKVESDLREAFERDYTREEACHHANISKDTFYRWLDESDEFKAMINKWETHLFRMAKNNVAENIKKKKSWDTWELLKRRQKKLYSEQIDNKLSGEVTGTFDIIIGNGETKTKNKS